MGHQVNFYATPEDITQIEAQIRRIEPMTILHSRSPTARPRVVPSLNFREHDQSWLFYYLVRESDLPVVITEHVPTQGYWDVDVFSSPVIEFDRCFFDEKVLRRGRVYYVDGFYGADDAWVEKPESFQRWAKAVLRATRKCLKKHVSDYIGNEASTWLQNSGGKLVQ